MLQVLAIVVVSVIVVVAVVYVVVVVVVIVASVVVVVVVCGCCCPLSWRPALFIHPLENDFSLFHSSNLEDERKSFSKIETFSRSKSTRLKLSLR